MTSAGPGRPAAPVVGFAAYSGSGKTTLLRHVVTLLRDRGYRLGVIKHAHHDFDVDQPGKDSYELRRAGALQTLVSSSRRWALVTELDRRPELGLEELIERLDLGRLDLVIVEGFKHRPFPKVEVRRGESPAPPLYETDPHIVAVASADPTAEHTALPVFDLNRPEKIADFLISRFLSI